MDRWLLKGNATVKMPMLFRAAANLTSEGGFGNSTPSQLCIRGGCTCVVVSTARSRRDQRLSCHLQKYCDSLPKLLALTLLWMRCLWVPQQKWSLERWEVKTPCPEPSRYRWTRIPFFQIDSTLPDCRRQPELLPD